jgi:hypothetical protein
VYDICLPLGLWDCDDVLHCDCGRSWNLYYTPEADAVVIAQVQVHAARCAYAKATREGREPPPDPWSAR